MSIKMVPKNIFSPLNGLELKNRAANFPIISTKVNSLDKVLLGGIRCGALTNFFGPSGVGKTQLVFQLSVVTASSIKDGGLNSRVIFIDPTNTFRPERLKEISESRGLNSDHILSRIVVYQPKTIRENISVLEQIRNISTKSKPRLLIIDSVTANFVKTQLVESLFSIQSHLGEFLHLLRLEAIEHGLAIVTTNSVRARLTSPPSIVEVGGNILSQSSHFGVQLSRNESNFYAKLVQPSLDLQQGYYRIDKKGLIDIN